MLTITHRVRFNHISHHLWTPTPDPSPQGARKGEGRGGVVELERPWLKNGLT
jgi:hypothetical protein